ncbi:AlwI family type II restriction endonuclease, partial [Acinetobacter baumannii]|nr:AlwI family type II restriction endonuclease [Acinetobacter baumannii]
MSIWHFGNTTVRSALRLIDGLKIFVTTHGNIIGKENEIAFCKALANGGVINANFNSDNESGFSDTTYS